MRFVLCKAKRTRLHKWFKAWKIPIKVGRLSYAKVDLMYGRYGLPYLMSFRT